MEYIVFLDDGFDLSVDSRIEKINDHNCIIVVNQVETYDRFIRTNIFKNQYADDLTKFKKLKDELKDIKSETSIL